MQDLWPLDLDKSLGSTRAPVAILREQATILGQKTKNIVEAQVEPMVAKKPDSFGYGFHLVGPALGNYRYRLFWIEHGIDVYPLTIYAESAILTGFPSLFDEFGSDHRELASEEDFLATLQQIFASERTKQIISAIFAQSTAVA